MRIKTHPSLYSLLLLLFIALPFAHADDPAVFDITDYEAERIDPADDGPLFRAAVADAKSHIANGGSSAVVEIPSGTYTIGLDPNDSEYHLKFSSLENITIQGVSNATLIMTHWDAYGISLSSSKNVTLENITIDYDPLPFTQGTITSVDAANDYVYIDVHSGFPAPTEDVFTNRDIKGYVHTGGNIDNNRNEHRIYSPSLMSGQNYRLRSIDLIESDLVGKDLVLSTRGGTHAASVLISSSQFNEDPENPGEHLDTMLLKNVTINSSPGGAFIVRANDGQVTLENCTVTAPSGRLLSTNADGVHAKWNRAPVNIIGCDFSRMGDDAVNIAGSYQDIYYQAASNQIDVERHKTYQAGDVIQIQSPESGEILLEATVLSTSLTTWNGNNAIRLTLDSNLPTISTTDTLQSGRSIPDVISDLETCGAGSKIIGNNFGNHRARGMMLHAINATVEGNIFYQLRGPAIVLGPDYSWMEAMSGSGTVIRNNYFEDISRSNILIAPTGAANPAVTYSTKDIVIEGNLFSEYGQPSYSGRGSVGTVLYVNQGTNINFNNNIIATRHADAVPVKPVFIKISKDVSLLYNDFFEDDTVDDWLSLGVDVEDIHISSSTFSEHMNYANETALDAAWTQVASLGGNPLRLSTNDSISADEPFAVVGNATWARDLGRTIVSDWCLSFDMIHTQSQRNVWVGLLDDSGQEGYVVSWESGPSTSGEGYIEIKKIDLTYPLNSWYEIGTELTSTASGHTITELPFAHIELTWEAATGTLAVWVDGVQKSSVVDTSFWQFSKLYVRGNGNGAEGSSAYIDNIAVGTLNHFYDSIDYADDTELNTAWSLAATQGGNPVRLGTNSSISADEPFIMLGNATISRDLPQTITSDWHLSFDMIHTSAQRGGWVGLLDETGQDGYVVAWESGPSTGHQGYIKIKKIDLAYPLNSWSETGSQLTSTSSGHANTTTPFAHIDMTWEADTGTLTVWVDGVQKGSVVDTDFASFAKLYIRGNGSGAESGSIYYDNLIVNTLD